jgi:hypothetical protein
MDVDISFKTVASDIDGTNFILQGDDPMNRWRISISNREMLDDDNVTNNSSLPMVFVPIYDGQPQSISPAVALRQHPYREHSEWILDEKDRRVLWIPPDTRGSVSSCHGKKIVIGSRSSGKVTILDFSNDQVEHPVGD